MALDVQTHFAILARILRELGIPSLTDLDQRISAQKKLYLLKVCGLNMGGYVYTWDLYGPFSKDLANDLREYDSSKGTYDSIADKIKLTRMAADAISRARDLMNVPVGKNVPLLNWLELLCSVHFLAERYCRIDPKFMRAVEKNGGSALKMIEALLLSKKPHLREFRSAIPDAWEGIKEYISSRPRVTA